MLAKIQSPYTIGRDIVKPEDLYGRSNDIETLYTLIFQGTSHVQVLGERRFGKTSFLKTFIEVAKRRKEAALLVYCSVNLYQFFMKLISNYWKSGKSKCRMC